MSTVIGKLECPSCGGIVNVSEAKGGMLTGYCENPDCRAQTFYRSPKSVERLRAKFAGKPAAPVVETPAVDQPKKPAKHWTEEI